MLDAGIIAALKSIQEGYASYASALDGLPHLRVAKTSIGVLLNLSLGFGEYLNLDRSNISSPM